MTTRSRLPAWDGLTQSQTQFLDAMDRRQLTVSQITNPSPSATTAELAAKITEILEAHRTK